MLSRKTWEIFVFFMCAFRHFISVCAVCDHEQHEGRVKEMTPEKNEK